MEDTSSVCVSVWYVDTDSCVCQSFTRFVIQLFWTTFDHVMCFRDLWDVPVATARLAKVMKARYIGTRRGQSNMTPSAVLSLLLLLCEQQTTDNPTNSYPKATEHSPHTSEIIPNLLLPIAMTSPSHPNNTTTITSNRWTSLCFFKLAGILCTLKLLFRYMLKKLLETLHTSYTTVTNYTHVRGAFRK